MLKNLQITNMPKTPEKKKSNKKMTAANYQIKSQTQTKSYKNIINIRPAPLEVAARLQPRYGNIKNI